MATALITGASSGIGAEFARAFARRKTDLVLVARRQDRLTALAERLYRETGVQIQVIPQDLTAPNAGETLQGAIAAAGSSIDILINNAGFGDYGEFGCSDLSKQLQMLDLNVRSLVELAHRFLAPMQARGAGSIVNVASIAAFQPLPYMSVYAASKAFVLNFSEALWAENRDKGVSVLALCPGPTETEFFQVAGFDAVEPSNRPAGKLVDAAEVVDRALSALDRGDTNVVTGDLATQALVNLPRFPPAPVSGGGRRAVFPPQARPQARLVARSSGLGRKSPGKDARMRATATLYRLALWCLKTQPTA